MSKIKFTLPGEFIVEHGELSFGDYFSISVDKYELRRSRSNTEGDYVEIPSGELDELVNKCQQNGFDFEYFYVVDTWNEVILLSDTSFQDYNYSEYEFTNGEWDRNKGETLEFDRVMTLEEFYEEFKGKNNIIHDGTPEHIAALNKLNSMKEFTGTKQFKSRSLKRRKKYRQALIDQANRVNKLWKALPRKDKVSIYDALTPTTRDLIFY